MAPCLTKLTGDPSLKNNKETTKEDPATQKPTKHRGPQNLRHPTIKDKMIHRLLIISKIHK